MDLPFSPEDLTRLYRFALLLTGEEGAAEQVLYDACVECAARLGGYRSEEGRMACLMGTMRQKAKQLPASEGRGIARAFAALPEEERAALAGLYSGLLPARSLAEALKMPLEQMGGVLKSGRERLERSGMELGEPSLERAL
ncbi:MAG: hypothetical protein ABSE62_04580 [Chthoniobacteraceae bacterium]